MGFPTPRTIPTFNTMLKDSRVTAYVPAKDLARAKRFYDETVGLGPGKAGDAGVMYECANASQIFLYPSAFAGTNQASTAFWEVPDLEKEMAELRKRGVTFLDYDLPGLKTVNGIASDGSIRSSWFRDTEGNVMAIAQRVG